jgi:hypothetical protein
MKKEELIARQEYHEDREEEGPFEKVANPGTLADRVAEARQQRIEEVKKEQLIGTGLWFTEAGFISPYPDRLPTKQISELPDLLTIFADELREQQPPMVLAMHAPLGLDMVALSKITGITVGYIPNPDEEYVEWIDVIRDLPQLHPMDIPSVFQPLQLPPIVKEEEVALERDDVLREDDDNDEED